MPCLPDAGMIQAISWYFKVQVPLRSGQSSIMKPAGLCFCGVWVIKVVEKVTLL